MDKVLENFRKIHPISEGFIQCMDDNHDIISLRKGLLHLSSGQVCRKATFILEGAAAACLNNDPNKLTDFWEQNDFILPGYSLYTGEASEEGIIVLADCEVVQFRRTAILMFKDEYPEARIIFDHYGGVNEKRAKFRANMLTMRAADRLEEYKDRFPSIPALISRIQESSYIGIEPGTRSRLN